MSQTTPSVFNWAHSEPLEPDILPPDEVLEETVELDTLSQPTSIEMALIHNSPFVANNPVTETFAQAVMHAGKPVNTMTEGWYIEDGELVFSPFRTNGNVRISIPNTEQNRKLLETSTSLMDTFALSLIGLCWSKRRNQPAIISNDEILRAIDFKKYGSKRDSKAEQIIHELEMLGNFKLEYSKLIGRVQLKKDQGKKQHQGKGQVSFKDDRLLHLVRMNIDTGLQNRAYWNITPGQWAYYYLNREYFEWVARMPGVIIKMDWWPQRPADYFGKKLAYSLVGFSGGTATLKGPFRRNVSNLLCAIGELPLPDSRNNKWASRTKERMEKGLLRLVDMNILSHVDYDVKSSKSSGRYWARSWLNSNLSLQLHKSLQTKANPKANPKPNPKPRSSKNVESK